MLKQIYNGTIHTPEGWVKGGSIIFENGKIIERGDHDDLLKLKGRYYELCTGKAQLS